MRDNKKSAKLIALHNDLLKSYDASVNELNNSITFMNDDHAIETTQSPLDLAFKSGSAFMIRMILIKYFGHTKEDLDKREEELITEGKKV